MPVQPRVRAVVLAAGAARRFGGEKLLAELHGRPVLQHVLDRLAEAGIEDPLVVVAPDHAALRTALTLRRARLVVNPSPGDGLSSSLRVGWDAAVADEPPPDAILVLLGDQPLVRPAVVRALVTAALDSSRPIVAPRYASGGGRNPVRIERSAAHLVLSVSGDRGLGPVIDTRPDLVREIDVPGTNPDIDRPTDLEAIRGVEGVGDGPVARDLA